MAPQTNLSPVRDVYQNVVRTALREDGLTEDITITSHYDGLQGKHYETALTINPPLLERSGYCEGLRGPGAGPRHSGDGPGEDLKATLSQGREEETERALPKR